MSHDACRMFGAELPLTTTDIPGIGGRIKVTADDFEVEELPSYEPAGTGVHLYLWVEKRDLPGDEAIGRIAAGFGCRVGDVGHAGIKDKRAVTRQWFSVLDENGRWTAADAEPSSVDLGEGLKVIRHSRHGNRLRTGHLRGNRFGIVVRGATGDATSHAAATLGRLASGGMPNFYGTQRFGKGGSTLQLGLAILGGDGSRTVRKASRSRFRRRLAISSVQSGLFNQYLCARLQRGLVRCVIEGDIMCRRASGGMFEAEDAMVEQARFDAGEIVVTGPMFGHRMRRAMGAPGALEQEVLDAAGISVEDFRAVGKLGRGTRRPVLAYPESVHVESVEGGVRLAFDLPKGSYATVLLREVMGEEASQ